MKNADVGARIQEFAKHCAMAPTKKGNAFGAVELLKVEVHVQDVEMYMRTKKTHVNGATGNCSNTAAWTWHPWLKYTLMLQPCSKAVLATEEAFCVQDATCMLQRPQRTLARTQQQLVRRRLLYLLSGCQALKAKIV